jgi:ATP-dependent DNA helicase MPH1
MHNHLLWHPSSCVVFLAPTRPLAAQQHSACSRIIPLPPPPLSLTLTGNSCPRAQRAKATPLSPLPPKPISSNIVTSLQVWSTARVIFATPQVLANDLQAASHDTRHAMISRMSLVVVDEAHRAAGHYAYCKVMDVVYNSSGASKPRVLALTATPGSSWAALQEAVTALRVSAVLHRSEECPDVQRHVHRRLCTMCDV